MPGAEPVRLWKDFLRQLARDYAGNRVVFSCSSSGLHRHVVIQDLPVAKCARLSSNAQVQEFSPSTARSIARRYGRISSTPQLDLLRSPYCLEAARGADHRGESPAGRAALFMGLTTGLTR